MIDHVARRPVAFWGTVVLVLAVGVGVGWRWARTYQAVCGVLCETKPEEVDIFGQSVSNSGTFDIETVRDGLLSPQSIEEALAAAGIEPTDVCVLNTGDPRIDEAIAAVQREVRVRLSQEAVRGTRIFIEMQGRDKAVATALVLALAQNYADRLAAGTAAPDGVPTRCTLEVLPATTRLSGGQLAQASAISMVVSVIAGFLVVRLLGGRGTSFESVADAENYLPFPVVGVVPARPKLDRQAG